VNYDTVLDPETELIQQITSGNVNHFLIFSNIFKKHLKYRIVYYLVQDKNSSKLKIIYLSVNNVFNKPTELSIIIKGQFLW
jgi:hypothetical protein